MDKRKLGVYKEFLGMMRRINNIKIIKKEKLCGVGARRECVEKGECQRRCDGC